jgi:hypothetical protein
MLETSKEGGDLNNVQFELFESVENRRDGVEALRRTCRTGYALA